MVKRNQLRTFLNGFSRGGASACAQSVDEYGSHSVAVSNIQEIGWNEQESQLYP
jgi:hypothetical protein